MLIDWFTVSFQVINFLILIALLKRFLYGPIIRAMEERESTIAARLFEAERAEKEAETRAALLAKDQESFVRSRNQMEVDALREINKWKEDCIERIKDEIEQKRTSWQQNLNEEQEEFLQKLKIHISRQVFQVARKSLADLADTSLETIVLKNFLEKVPQEPGKAVEKSIQRSNAVLVKTGFPLEAPMKAEIKTRIAGYFPLFARVDLKEDKTLGFGVCLRAGDQQWEWNLSRYMRDIEKDVIKGMGGLVNGKNE